jgi:nicotinamidase-related amidase
LLVIDVQRAFDQPRWGRRNNPQAEANIAALLADWRREDGPILHIQHRNERPGCLFSPEQPGFQVKPEAAPLPSEPVLFKTVNSGFIGTDLEQRLRRGLVEHLVIVGITTDHCVSTTSRMAANLGFGVTVVADATCTFERTGPDGRHWGAEDMHSSALASLNDEFATITDTADLLATCVSRR